MPDLVELGLASGETLFFSAADLLQSGCNETVALPTKSGVIAMSGSRKKGC